MYRILGVLTICTAYLFAGPVHTAELVIENTQGLSFGTFVAGNGGTVTVNSNGLRSADGGVVLIPSSYGTAAEFTITGDGDATFTIELPANGFVKLTGPGPDMTVNDFTRTPSAAEVQLSPGGAQTLSVGGTLNVGSSQTPGAYSGTFTVIVNYN